MILSIPLLYNTYSIYPTPNIKYLEIWNIIENLRSFIICTNEHGGSNLWVLFSANIVIQAHSFI